MSRGLRESTLRLLTSTTCPPLLCREAHIWVQQPRAKGFQRHLGSYHTAEDAARCYDRAAIRFRGPTAELNFEHDSYAEDEFMKVWGRRGSGGPELI